MKLKMTFENLTPEEAAEVLKFRIQAMLNGTVYVRPHVRQIPRWGRLASDTRTARIARYALRLTKNRDEARTLTGLPATAFKPKKGG